MNTTLLRLYLTSLSSPGPPRLTFKALRVLQTEAGLVALGHLAAVGRQQVIVGEDVHAVVVAEKDRAKTTHEPISFLNNNMTGLLAPSM